jgi:hypothetical protein
LYEFGKPYRGWQFDGMGGCKVSKVFTCNTPSQQKSAFLCLLDSECKVF